MPRQIILQHPVHDSVQLKTFETELRRLTNGDSLTRTVAYGNFRVAVIKLHQKREPVDGSTSKTILPNYHFISLDNLVATLYRNLGPEAPTNNEDMDNGDSDTEHDDQPMCKRVKQ
jgi:hypothetical protein